MTTPVAFPFSAVVGQDEVKLALLLAAVDPALAGVLLRGEKGSAKTTLARGLAALLPGAAPFVELPVGATEDRLVGTLDLAAALTGGEVRLQPGLLAAAHGGILYVDEVNLLPDHLVDVLLDVAASGINRVEREGVSHIHPSRFVLIGSMNPEEGELRPQLLDRFGLAVDVHAPSAPAVRALAVHRRMAFDRDPAGFADQWAAEEAALAEHLASAVPAPLVEGLVERVSALCAEVGAQGLRADLTICRAAAALAGLEGRAEVSRADVRKVAALALGHRRRRGPFDQPGMTEGELDDALDRADAHNTPPPASAAPPPSGAPATAPPGGTDPASGPAAEPPPPGAGDPHSRPAPGTAPAHQGAPRRDAGDRVVAAGPTVPVVRLAAHSTTRAGFEVTPGRRSVVEGPRGRLVSDRAPDGPLRSLAVGATVRTAAARWATTHDPASPTTLRHDVAASDLREAVRQQRAGNLVVIAVDASGSMRAARRMEAAKGAVLGLLLDAYQRRDKIALVTFRQDQATVALRPTSSVEVARARLSELPTGGRTPLAAGIRTALEVASIPGGAGLQPLLVLITDGRATSCGGDRPDAGPVPHQEDPVQAAHAAARAVRARRVSAAVIDAEDGPTRLGLARELADVMGARYLTLPELSATALDHTIRSLRPGPN